MDTEHPSYSITQLAGIYQRLGDRPIEGFRVRLYSDGRAQREQYRDMGGKWLVYCAGTFVLEGNSIYLVLKPTEEFDYPEAYTSPELSERLHIRRDGKRLYLVPEEKVVEFDTTTSGRKDRAGMYRRAGNANDP